MGWIELALKDFVDLIRMLLAFIHVWKTPVRSDSLWQCIVFKSHQLHLEDIEQSMQCIHGTGLQ